MSCTKKSYPDKKSADSMINYVKKNRTRKKLPKRSYFCNECNAWHITSKK